MNRKLFCVAYSIALTAHATVVFAQSEMTMRDAMMEVEGDVLPGSELPPLPDFPNSFADGDLLPDSAPIAVDPEPYTLESILALAAGNNPTIGQARLHVSAEMAKALQAGLYPNPVLMYIGENINSGGTAGEFQGFEVQQRFVTAGKLDLSRQKYLQRARVSEHLAIAQTFRVSNSVEVQFIEALAASQRLQLRVDLERTAEDSAVTSRELYNQGQANLTDVRRSNVMLQQRRLDRLETENEFHEALRNLAALVGVSLPSAPVAGELRPTETLEPFENVYSRLTVASPELLAARAKLRADQITVRRERVEWVPDIVVQGGPGYNFEGNGDVYNVGVRLEIPLFDKNQGTIRQACADMRRQQLEIRRLELHLRERLAMAYRTYATNLQHATEYEQVVIPELKAAYRQLLISYKEDRIAWPDVLEGQQQYFQARLDQIDQFKNVLQQQTMIAGYLLDGGLMAAESPVPPGHIDAVPKPR